MGSHYMLISYYRLLDERRHNFSRYDEERSTRIKWGLYDSSKNCDTQPINGLHEISRAQAFSALHKADNARISTTSSKEAFVDIKAVNMNNIKAETTSINNKPCTRKQTFMGDPVSSDLRHLLQPILSASLIFLICASALPSYYFYKWAENLEEPWSFIDIPPYTLGQLNGLALVLIVPIWALTFTTVVIFLKWIIIGKYIPGNYVLYGMLLANICTCHSI
mmetsp:Transcript_21641/g.30338  ORF Transcript_21641/g.30338 Transcript_21641/m.30338 type:complete len:221 (-) Transcript_21641:2425-3087(-)